MKRKNLELISKYLEEAKDWVTAEELAAALHTTTRTVRNYIQSLREDNEGVDGRNGLLPTTNVRVAGVFLNLFYSSNS
ncbi:helix-turn-helix domain-containing protein [Hungatella sp.]|uniref:helix-turn-helix domain-containing protein n=1 Tax=Hungatella sp. TaxID=2613924 RepID=UPI002A82DD33|nr:helix-turn-helix domain-containing protein [Hungatella sp.]